jgi:hypothetical protein
MSEFKGIRINTGLINTVNDAVVGQQGASLGPGGTKYAGMLGKWLWLDDSQLFYDSSVGTVYGGRFRYVRLAAAAGAVVAGQIVFWDISVADSLYQVTTAESGSTSGAMFRAGIVLNPNWTAGYYSYIQELGPVPVKFRASLTDSPAIGCSVYCAAAGAGVDVGLADVITNASVSNFSDIALLQGRYIGAAIQLPVAGAVKLVNVNFMNLRG